MLPFQRPVKVVGLIGALFGTDKFCLNKLPCNHFEGLPVLLIHCQQKEREHDYNHAEGGPTGTDLFFEQKEKRYSYQYRRGKADKLPLC